MKLFEFSATQQQGTMQRWGGIIGVPWTDFTCTRLHLSLIAIILTSIKWQLTTVMQRQRVVGLS